MMIIFLIMYALQLLLLFAVFVMLGGYVVFKQKLDSYRESKDVDDDLGYLDTLINEQGR